MKCPARTLPSAQPKTRSPQPAGPQGQTREVMAHVWPNLLLIPFLSPHSRPSCARARGRGGGESEGEEKRVADEQRERNGGSGARRGCVKVRRRADCSCPTRQRRICCGVAIGAAFSRIRLRCGDPSLALGAPFESHRTNLVDKDNTVALRNGQSRRIWRKGHSRHDVILGALHQAVAESAVEKG